MVIISNPDRLSEIAIFSVYLFYIQAFFAVFILRKRNKGIKRAYSVPLYPFILILAIIGAGFVVVSTVFDNPQDSLLAIGITLAGLPIYWLLQRRRVKKENHIK